MKDNLLRGMSMTLNRFSMKIGSEDQLPIRALDNRGRNVLDDLKVKLGREEIFTRKF